MQITGTFLDEISHDIPHQNWGPDEWERDFQYMREAGIDTVILIRCGYRRWQTYPSLVITREAGGYPPPVDLVRLFLDLSERYGMAFYFGLYDSGAEGYGADDQRREVELNLKIIEEAWTRYGDSPAFQGWYLSQEVSRNTGRIIDLYAQLGRHCKAVSGGLPILISPYIDGPKALLSSQASLTRQESVTLEQHERDWDAIFAGIQGAVDIVAFQDGHVDYHELPAYFAVNKRLAERYGLRSWTNAESFDRDMPIKFLPIKWEKLRLKLEAAREAGLERAITFEFSHFMSPQSAYPQAHHLYRRYQAYRRALRGQAPPPPNS